MLDLLNEEYLKCNYGNNDYWCFSIKNSLFLINFSGGKEYSDPPENLDKINLYNKIGVSIYDIKNNDRMHYHIAVSPRFDYRFKDQSWARDFLTNLGFVSPNVACDIISYCDTMAKYKIFW